MTNNPVKEDILRTLLYYDIFNYPLKPEEIFIFLPRNSLSKNELGEALDRNKEIVKSKDGFFYIEPNHHSVSLRRQRELISKRHRTAARFMTHIIKRFPFVRCVLITGSLSKNSSDRTSDLDFMVITKSGRLWIARTLLMLFKKIFLFNSYKYFCINYFITEDSLEVEEKNIFTATEIATVKATFNEELMKKFIDCNDWVGDFFPNSMEFYSELHTTGYRVNNRRSYLQRFFELFFAGTPGDKLNERLRKMTNRYTRRKYKNVCDEDWNLMFASSQTVSKTFPGNMQRLILEEYERRLRRFNLPQTAQSQHG